METKTKTNWSLDMAHSKVNFKVKHLMISTVLGSFKEFDGEVNTDGNDFTTASINLSLKAASINTDAPDRDNHLRSADFLEAEKYPTLTFESTGIKDMGDDIYELTGNLSIKGISKKVVLSVEFGGLMTDPWGNIKAGFSVTGKINRKDWGLNWNAALEAGGFLVGDEVKIDSDIELLKATK
jgi:polyisoprenoid-binding protein YceI